MIAQKAVADLQPDYKVPLSLWLKIGWSLLVDRERSVLSDSQSAFQDGRPDARFVGQENIPSEDSCLVVCNHFYRPGFDAWWIALGVSAAFEGCRREMVDEDIHWVMTSAWTFPEHPFRARFFTPMTRVLFSGLARIYGFITMPPMPPAPDEVQERALAVLKAVRLAKLNSDSGVLIGLAPEGRDFETGMGEPPEGAGEFISLLVKSGLKVLPVGVYEDEEKLVVSFGEVFEPEIPEDPSLRDSQVAAQVMTAIRELVPDHLVTNHYLLL